jgi:NAD(P)-dependent dehydrogenase (short-subunit alcohol dehydrogenase family)
VRQSGNSAPTADAAREYAQTSETSLLCAQSPTEWRTVTKVDIVVADAANPRWKPLPEMKDADWRDVIDNNLNGTANTIRAFAPKMVSRKKGRIIVLSSMQGNHGTKDAASYSASKWGIIGLMKSAAMELGQYNITVDALLPGGIISG